MKEVAKLQTGSSFGELALINNEPRKATIMCLTDCHFAVLEKKDYVKILQKIQLKDFNKKVDFFAQLPFLQFQTQNQIAKIVHSFTVKNYNLHHYVYHQGVQPTHVYIIRDGDFEIIRKRRIKKSNDDSHSTRSMLFPKSITGSGYNTQKLKEKSHDEMEIKVSTIGKG